MSAGQSLCWVQWVVAQRTWQTGLSLAMALAGAWLYAVKGISNASGRSFHVFFMLHLPYNRRVVVSRCQFVAPGFEGPDLCREERPCLTLLHISIEDPCQFRFWLISIV